MQTLHVLLHTCRKKKNPCNKSKMRCEENSHGRFRPKTIVKKTEPTDKSQGTTVTIAKIKTKGGRK